MAKILNSSPRDYVIAGVLLPAGVETSITDEQGAAIENDAIGQHLLLEGKDLAVITDEQGAEDTAKAKKKG